MDRRQRLEQFEQEQSIAFGGGAIGAWPRHKGEKLRPHKGGGGGDGGARQMEEERQARINAAVSQINNIFNNKRTVDGDPANSREQMYTNQRQAVYDLNTRDVNRQAADAERLNRFALARNGLLGGSADVDSGFEINRMTNEGLMKAGGIADQAAADLRMSDERTRGNLISMAQSGIDTGTAQQMALSGLAANAEAAKSSAAAATVGDLFSGLSGAYMGNMYNNAYKAGLDKSRMQQFTPGLGGVQSSYSGNVVK